MPSYPLRGLVLRLTKLGEADQIVTVFGSDGRQVRAVAKSMRKPTSRFGGRLQPYATVDLLLHTGRSLEIVSEAQLVTPRAALREDYDRGTAAAVVADLLDKLSTEGQAEERLYSLGEAALDRMVQAPVDALPLIVTAFLVKAMAMHGYRPELEVCVACAGDLATADRFSVHAGGALCTACGPLDPSSLRVPGAAREWLRVLLGSTFSQIVELDMPPQATADAFDIIRAFIAYHVPARLKALDYYAATVSAAAGE